MNSEDSDEIYDEIDRYHMSLDASDSDENDTRIPKQLEVLNVEGDSSGNDDDIDDVHGNEKDRNSFSDSDDDDLNNVENCKF